MNWYPNNNLQSGGPQNQFRPRPHFRPPRPRFENNFRNRPPFSAPAVRGQNSETTYQPRAVYNYRSSQPNRFQWSRSSNPSIRPPRVPEPTNPKSQSGQFQQNLMSADPRPPEKQFPGTPISESSERPNSREETSNGSTSGQFGLMSQTAVSETNISAEKNNSHKQNHSVDLKVDSQGTNIGQKQPDIKTGIDVDSSTNYQNTTKPDSTQSALTESLNVHNTVDTDTVSGPGGPVEDKDKTVSATEEVPDPDKENASNKGEDDEEDGDSSDEDTSYCKYCKRSFTSAFSYHSHTRGMVHMNLYMEAQAAKEKQQSQTSNGKTTISEEAEQSIKDNNQQTEQTAGQKTGPANQETKYTSSQQSANEHRASPIIQVNQVGSESQYMNKSESKTRKEGLSVQHGQIDSFLKEKKQKELERKRMFSERADSRKTMGSGQSLGQFGNESQASDGMYDYGEHEEYVDDDNAQYGEFDVEEDIENQYDFNAGDYDTDYNRNDAQEYPDDFNDNSVDTAYEQHNKFRQSYDYDTSVSSKNNTIQPYGDSTENYNYSTKNNSNREESGQVYRNDYYAYEGEQYTNTGQFHTNQRQFDRRGSFGVGSDGNLVEQDNWDSAEVENVEENAGDDVNEDSSSEDEDTSYCKYCKLSFTSGVAYHAHTRGLQHTTLIMEAKQKKGDQRFRKERVAPEVLKVEIPEPKAESKQVTEADVPEDYDFETNWMNLDEDLIERLKSKKKASERDLNPDEIGKQPFKEDFSCAVCNVQCTSALAFKMHVDGKHHRNNMEAIESGNKSKLKQKKSTSTVFTAVENDDVESQFSRIYADSDAALVGLEYVTEFQKPDPKAACRYVCNLCEAKCDSATILPHLVGVRHRLHYFKETHNDIYTHLTKYTSKKKKSEMNVSAEDFAKQVVEREGQKDVKVKIEIDAGAGEADLDQIMARMSKALKEKLQEFDKTEDNKEPNKAFGSKGQSGLPKGSSGKVTQANKTGNAWSSERNDPTSSGPFRRPFRLPRDPYGQTRDPYGPTRDPYGPTRDPYGPAREPYGPSRGPFGPRRDPYDIDRGHFEYEDERYKLDRMLDDYRLADPYEEYRRLDRLYDRQIRLREFESRRLDDLLLDRHRLEDPMLEKSRLDDIMLRKKKIAEAETARLDDIMRRKRLLEENDVDKLRIQRYEKLRKVTPEQDVTSARETERPSLEDLIASRRKANYTSAAQETRPLADESLLPSRYSAANQPLTTKAQTVTASAAHTQGPTPTLQANRSVETAKKVVANKELQEELAKNPGVNIGELLGNLTSSMIATEDDAAMALQISNALTQALLKFRLQHATKQLAKTDTAKPAVEKAIPGLGSSTTHSSQSVPSFLRTSTNQPSSESSVASTAIQSSFLKAYTHVAQAQSKTNPATDDFSSPLASSKRKSNVPIDSNTPIKEAKRVLPTQSESPAPQKDLLKSIREQAKKLQAQIASKALPSSSLAQPSIQAHSQFVHGQAPYTQLSATSRSTEQHANPSSVGNTGTLPQTIQTLISGSSAPSSVPATGTSTAWPYSGNAYGQYNVAAGNIASYSQPVPSTGGTLTPTPPVLQGTTSTATHVNPAFYSQWLQSMYATGVNVTNSGPVQQPVQPPLPPAAPPAAPPPPPHVFLEKKN